VNPVPVLVTGGAGYVGSHACKALAQNGFLPVTVDNLVYGHEWAVRWGPLIKGDISDRALLDTVFSNYKPVAVLHFAAFAYVGESVVAPDKYYRNNVAGTLTLLDALLAHCCTSIVFSSTCATYGVPHQVPIQESHPQRPINPYGQSKLMIEQILLDYEKAFGLRHVILRYFNAAGADTNGEIGEDHEPETHLLPLTIQAALRQRESISIFGTDYPTPDGTAIRDYIHVTDLADVHVLALQHLLAGKGSLAMNVGTGNGHSVRDVISMVETVTGLEVPVQEAPRREGDPPELVADPGEALRVLGWQARCSDLLTIIASAAQWHHRYDAAAQFQQVIE
jgi:UDP-glucose-4-epimerase GalE